MISYRVSHATTYEYSEPVSLCQNVAHLFPRAAPGQRTDGSVLTVTPEPAVTDQRVDYFGNPVHYFTIQQPHRRLSVEVVHRVVLDPPALAAADDTSPWEA